MNIALILAGGVGTRMGQKIPKQFMIVNDKPIIIHTLEIFEKHPEIDKIYVICIEGWESVLSCYSKHFNISKLQGIVRGGVDRYFSIRNGLNALEDVRDDDVIILHDSVRPMVTSESISSTIAVCKKYGNSMSVIPCEDTMYERTSIQYTTKCVNRDKMVRGQTPEAITGKIMKGLYKKADEKGICNDSISALQNQLGLQIHFAQGAKRNIKITSIEDIAFFKATLMLENWRA